MADNMHVVGGVRYRDEDLKRLGISKGAGKDPKPISTKSAKQEPVTEQKGADDARTVSGGSNGSGDADEHVSVKPETAPRTRPSK